jgi:hypothetical protein
VSKSVVSHFAFDKIFIDFFIFLNIIKSEGRWSRKNLWGKSAGRLSHRLKRVPALMETKPYEGMKGLIPGS